MNPTLLVIGLVLAYASLAVLVWTLGPVHRRRDLHGMGALAHGAGPGRPGGTGGFGRSGAGSSGEGLLSRLAERTTSAAGSLLARRKASAALAERLEFAGLTMSPPEFTVLVAVGAVVGVAIGMLLGAPVLAILLALLAPLLAWLLLGVLVARRRAAFAEQLESSLQLISSSLRAGHSLLRALDAVAQESQSPTREEFSRVINQARLGRDVNEALREVADRMESKDFLWMSQAVTIHREVGGNLADVLDGTGQTIRERGQVRGLIKTLSAEGRISGVILMGLPVLVAGILMLVQPSYITPLFQHPLGLVLLVAAAVMFGIGGFWMSRVVKIDF